MISIITITFNAEKTLRRTMESVANQTCRDYEHIVIDGASRDRTLAIARSYEGVRILSEPDRGLYDAMNKGIAMARGEYLLFLNAGDTFSGPEVLEAYAERTRKGDDIIFGRAGTWCTTATPSATPPPRILIPESAVKKSG